MKINWSEIVDKVILSFIVLFIWCLLVSTKSDVFKTIQDWQPLIAGFFAIVAAWITIGEMRYQKEDDLKRKELTVRAKMQDAISSLMILAEECFDAIMKDEPKSIPNFDNQGIAVFKEGIAYLEPSIRKRALNMLSFYQVYQSRLRGYFRNTPANKNDIMYDTIRLNAYFVGFFDYARQETSSLVCDSEKGHMFQAVKQLMNLGYVRKEYGECMDILKSKHPDWFVGEDNDGYRPVPTNPPPA